MSTKPDIYFQRHAASIRTRTQYNFRAIWFEAEIFIFGKLRLGLHPKQLERELNKDLQVLQDNKDDYRILFRSTCQRILDNLENERLFKKLPSITVYDELVGVPVRKARFEVMMHNRFKDEELLKQEATDDMMEQDIEEDDELLDASYLEVMTAIHETICKEVEENYTANQKFLDESPSDNFVDNNMRNPFICSEYQQPWEGPGIRPGPGRNTIPLHPYVKPTSQSCQLSVVAAVEEEKLEEVMLEKEELDEEKLDEEMLEEEKPEEEKLTSSGTQISGDRTPKNKTDQPEFRFEQLGRAFHDRPVDLGSPKKPKRKPLGPLRRKGPASKRFGMRLDASFDVFGDNANKTPEKRPDSAKDSRGEVIAQAYQTLEEYMSWANDIIRKSSVLRSQVAIADDQNKHSEKMG